MKRTISFRPYIIAIALVIVVFAVTDYFLVQSIENFFLETLENEYINYANVYSHGLTKSAEAYGIINDILERRLLSASRTAGLYSDLVTNATLVALSDTLAVDEIYLYNPTGVIEYSTRGAYLGWEALPGHPVHDFMISGAPYLVEDIRPDTESGELYKYGYFRLDDGRFLQLGIRADLVESFLSPFEVQLILEEISAFEIVDHICFVDNNFTITASTVPSLLGTVVDHPEIREAISSGSTYSLVTHAEYQGGDVYEVYVPIRVGSETMGTLMVGKSTDASRGVVRKAISLGIAATTVVFIAFVYVMLSNYRYNKRLVNLAFQDALTGLPNKSALEEALARELASSQREKGAVVMIHCRNVSEINTAYGFDVGDRVMKTQGERLQAFVQEDRKLFRFAGNRYVFYVRNYNDKTELISLAEQVVHKLEEPMDFISREIGVTIGLVELEDKHCQAVDVLTQASSVIHHLESSHATEKYAFFDARIEEITQRQETIAREMAEFLANTSTKTMYLHYQPKVALATNQIVGFEALARMNSPSLGMVSPGEFIPIVERHELIVPFGLWVLKSACQFIKELVDRGYDGLYVAVNISVIQCLQSDFTSKVQEIVEEVGIEPHALQLEITESVLIEDFAEIEAKLQPLRELGITIAVDDFGTGYSALSRLEELPVDYIKIDKSFIDNILVKDEERLIIQELIAMCHKLGLKVVAEGVEEEKQRHYLTAIGCDIMQGYLFSRPLDAEKALEKLKAS